MDTHLSVAHVVLCDSVQLKILASDAISRFRMMEASRDWLSECSRALQVAARGCMALNLEYASAATSGGAPARFNALIIEDVFAIELKRSQSPVAGHTHTPT